MAGEGLSGERAQRHIERFPIVDTVSSPEFVKRAAPNGGMDPETGLRWISDLDASKIGRIDHPQRGA